MKIMRKTIYIVLAALGLCLFAGCGSSDKEKVSPLVKQLAGEWQLKTWNGEAPRDFDAYVSFGADRSFEIYQRIEQVGYQKYSGKYEIRNGMLGGVYSDGKPFGSTYDITFDESGNTLTLTSATNVTEVSVYERSTIPNSVKEGAAVKDFMTPDRVVVGTDSERARKIMARLYKPFMLNTERMIFTDIPSAEMIKYAANSMLATRISFMNDIANLCEIVGADVNMVRHGIASDTRIGRKFLYPGCGYGGSCFPKDVKALIRTAEQNGYDMRVLRAVEEVNEHQKSVLFEKLSRHFNGDLKRKRVTLWGLSFKPETDDMREAPSLVLIKLMTEAGVTVRVYDPIAMEECRRRIGDTVEYATDMYEAAIDADALMMVTEWKQFRMPSLQLLKKVMHTPVIFDGRNIYDGDFLRQNGFTYYKIG